MDTQCIPTLVYRVTNEIWSTKVSFVFFLCFHKNKLHWPKNPQIITTSPILVSMSVLFELQRGPSELVISAWCQQWHHLPVILRKKLISLDWDKQIWTSASVLRHSFATARKNAVPPQAHGSTASCISASVAPEPACMYSLGEAPDAAFRSHFLILLRGTVLTHTSLSSFYPCGNK